MKIIGIEYRLISPQGRVLELAVFPLELAYPCMDGRAPDWNVTTHTTEGDRTIDSRYQGGQSLPSHPYSVACYDWDKEMARILMARAR